MGEDKKKAEGRTKVQALPRTGYREGTVTPQWRLHCLLSYFFTGSVYLVNSKNALHLASGQPLARRSTTLSRLLGRHVGKRNLGAQHDELSCHNGQVCLIFRAVACPDGLVLVR